MASGRITKRTVDAALPAARDLFIWDEDLKGFGLRVTPKGSKSYVVQYRMGGRGFQAQRYTIGKHGSPWTPELARKEAERLLILVRQKVDPLQADRDRQREAKDLAFNLYVENFSKLYLEERWKHWQLGTSVLRRHVVPVLRNRPLPKLTRSDLNPIWDRLQNRPAVARLTYATLRKLFRWAVARGDIERSPMEGLEPPRPVPARDRVLSDEELAALWSAIFDLGAPFDSYFKVLVLTAQRRDEVARMDWRELCRTSAEWSLPAKRTKNAKAHHVPLSPMMVRLLDEIAGNECWPRQGLVFSTTGTTPISGFSKAKKRLDESMAKTLGIRFAAWRAHDIRRTVATGLQRLGVRLEVTEAVLNHVSGSRSPR